MSEPMSDPMRRQRTNRRRLLTGGLLPGAQRPSEEPPILGHLCEVCLDAPATRLQLAPWSGEMGACETCAAPGAQTKGT
jgi:hypothetical protein